VAENGTGIWNGAGNLSASLWVLWDVIVFPLKKILHQDPEDDVRSQWDWCKFMEFETRPKEASGLETKAEER